MLLEALNLSKFSLPMKNDLNLISHKKDCGILSTHSVRNSLLKKAYGIKITLSSVEWNVDNQFISCVQDFQDIIRL